MLKSNTREALMTIYNVHYTHGWVYFEFIELTLRYICNKAASCR